MKLTEMMLAQQVGRWNIVRTTKDQSVAEHMYNVCMIARSICARLKIDDTMVMKAALEHDLDEVFTGDIPHPAKVMAMKAGMDLNSMIPPPKNVAKLTPTEKLVLKIADLLEAEYFIKEFGVTSRALDAYIDLGEQVNNILAASPTHVRAEARKVREELSNPRGDTYDHA